MDFQILDMAGARPEHSTVIVNFVAAIREQLLNSTCYTLVYNKCVSSCVYFSKLRKLPLPFGYSCSSVGLFRFTWAFEKWLTIHFITKISLFLYSHLVTKISLYQLFFYVFTYISMFILA